MADHVWNVGVVQNQEFPKRIALVVNPGGRSCFVIVTSAGGGPVKIIIGDATAAILPPQQSLCVAADRDVYLELEDGPRRGATGHFSVVA